MREERDGKGDKMKRHRRFIGRSRIRISRLQREMDDLYDFVCDNIAQDTSELKLLNKELEKQTFALRRFGRGLRRHGIIE